MSSILIHRLELAPRCDLALDADLLDWLADTAGLGQSDLWLRHARGLVGDLGGALRVVDDLFPRALWTVGSRRKDGDFVFDATLIPAGARSPFVSTANHAANALLATTLRAHAVAQSAGARYKVAAQ